MKDIPAMDSDWNAERLQHLQTQNMPPTVQWVVDNRTEKLHDVEPIVTSLHLELRVPWNRQPYHPSWGCHLWTMTVTMQCRWFVQDMEQTAWIVRASVSLWMTFSTLLLIFRTMIVRKIPSCRKISFYRCSTINELKWKMPSNAIFHHTQDEMNHT